MSYELDNAEGRPTHGDGNHESAVEEWWPLQSTLPRTTTITLCDPQYVVEEYIAWEGELPHIIRRIKPPKMSMGAMMERWDTPVALQMDIVEYVRVGELMYRRDG